MENLLNFKNSLCDVYEIPSDVEDGYTALKNIIHEAIKENIGLKMPKTMVSNKRTRLIPANERKLRGKLRELR